MAQSCCVMLRLTLHSISSALKLCPTMLAVLCGLTMVGVPPHSTAQTISTPPKHALKLKARTTQAPAPTGVAVLPPAVRFAPKETSPVPPQVLWKGSQLTIITNNSTLADILALVHAHTGADIDMPESASRQQMAARLGPGPVREVLSSLLSWTGFNYVIQASDKNPDSIQSILLIPRPKDAVEVATTRSAREEEYRQASEPAPDVAEAQNPPETPVSPQTATAVEPIPASEPPAQQGPIVHLRWRTCSLRRPVRKQQRQFLNRVPLQVKPKCPLKCSTSCRACTNKDCRYRRTRNLATVRRLNA